MMGREGVVVVVTRVVMRREEEAGAVGVEGVGVDEGEGVGGGEGGMVLVVDCAHYAAVAKGRVALLVLLLRPALPPVLPRNRPAFRRLLTSAKLALAFLFLVPTEGVHHPGQRPFLSPALPPALPPPHPLPVARLSGTERYRRALDAVLAAFSFGEVDEGVEGVRPTDACAKGGRTGWGGRGRTREGGRGEEELPSSSESKGYACVSRVPLAPLL
jgi:hypothetical protein